MNKPNAPGEGSELPAQILEAIGYFSVEPVTIEDALSLLRQKRQETEDWQKLAEAKVIELKAALSSPQQESAEDAYRRAIKELASLACGWWGSSFGAVINERLKIPYVAPPVTAEGKDRG